MRGAVKGRLGDRGAYLVAFGVCMHAWVSVCVYERARDLEGFTRADLMRRKTTLTGQRLSLHLK